MTAKLKWGTGWWGGFLLTMLLWRCHAEQVMVSRIQCEPRPGLPEYIELYNNTSNPLDIARWSLTGAASYQFPDFSPAQPKASFLRPFERIVLSAADPSATRAAYGIAGSVRIFGPWSGKLKPKKDRITLQDKNGVVLCQVRYGRVGLWPTPPPATGQALVLLDPNREVDDWRNWGVSGPADSPPGAAPMVNRTSLAASPEIEANLGRVLVDYGAIWSANDSGQNLAARWRQPAFDDRTWKRGPGLLGFDPKPLPNPGLRTQLNLSRQLTYYFRTQFTYAGDKQPGDRLILDQILDDGAVYYLNGQELARSRMPAGPVLFNTLSSSTVPTASEELNVFSLDPNLLLKGTNQVAVEVHQCSPGSSDVVFGMRLRLVPATPPGLVLNEIFLGGADGFVEVCNTAATPLNLKGCFLSQDAANLRQHSLAQDRVVPPGGVVALSLGEIGIHQADPLALYLTAADGRTVLNAIAANFASDGRSLGRSPDGAATWVRFRAPSRGAPNPKLEASILDGVNQLQPTSRSVPVSDVVINEIMFDPPYRAEGTEFVELCNRGTNAADLSSWRFDQGISYQFPAGTELRPGGYLAVAADLVRFKSVYGDVPVAGQFQGRLHRRGTLLRLVDASGRVRNEVDFKAGGDWPSLARGGGSSLELLNPWLDNSRSSAWRDSREAEKSAWRTYACTNTYLEMNPLGQPTDFRELHLYLVGAGHIALRNVGLFRSGINYLDNPGRMSTSGSSAQGWLAQGTHAATYMTNGELHVVSDGRGDNRADRVEIDCVRLQRGETYELRFDARWVSGCPRLVAQTWDRSVGSSFLIDLPAKLGTPGQPNSATLSLGPLGPFGPAAAALAPPQLDDLLHSPAVPKSTETVRVTVHASSPSPLAQVRLVHRADTADGNAPWTSKPMLPARFAGAEDLYMAELAEYQTNGQVVEFYVEAVAANGQRVTLPRAGAERPALFVVDDRKIAREGRTDRFVVSAYDLESMHEGNTAKFGFRQPRLSNHRYNMTFISNEESVFYGGAIRVSGSPFTRGRDLGKGKWELPADRPFRGRTKFFFDNDSNFHNRLCRYLLYQLGHVANDAEWIQVIINGSGAFLKEDTEPVTSEFLERVFPDGNHGELYRYDDEWWFTDNWEHNNRDADWNYKGTDDPLYYRTEWQKHSREVEDDFSALINFFKIYSSNAPSQQQLDQYLDSAAVLQMATVRGYISDWDSFTMFRGKNGYFYRRPADGRFQFLQWDSDLAFRPGNYPFYSDRVAAWLERPAHLALFKKDLNELARFAESAQLAAWFELEGEAVPERPVNAEFYKTFFRQRNQFLRLTGGSVRLR